MDKKFPDGIAEARDGMNNWAGTTDPEKEAGWIDYAMAWAAIAQAEQLKRIADALEKPTQSPIEQWRVVDGINQRID